MIILMFLFKYCFRAYECLSLITPVLCEISGKDVLSLSDIILGIIIQDKDAQTCFNWLIQHIQAALLAIAVPPEI